MPDPPTTRLGTAPRAPRRRTLLAGVVIHGAAAVTNDCAVRDVSDGGARIRLASLAYLARPLVLLIPSFDSAHEAEVVWQTGREIGLKFTREIRLQAPESELDRLARRLWLERCARPG